MQTQIHKTYYWLYNKLFPWIRLIRNIVLNSTRRLKNKNIVYCIGDSHNMVFEYTKSNNLLPDIDLRCVTVQGATVFGLANPNSKTNALKIFSREIKFAPKDQFLSVILGEVDCGFLIWHQANKTSSSVSEQLDASLTRYQNFLKNISALGYNNVLVYSVPPPTIKNGDNEGIVANQRSSVSTSIEERSQLTKKYNGKLKNIVRDLNFEFANIEPLLTESSTGLVKKEFLNQSTTDHHLDNKKASNIYVHALNEFIQSHIEITK